MLFGVHRLGTTVTTLIVAVALLVATAMMAVGPDAPAADPTGDAPLDRGWWNTARRACRDAAHGGDPAARAALAEQVAMIDRLEEESARVAAARHAWLRDPRGWRLRWSRPLPGSDLPAAPIAEPKWAGAVVAWQSGNAVHALLAADGRPAWRSGKTPDAALFPRGSAPGRAADRPGWLAPAGHLVFAAVEPEPAGAVLLCLDCSTTAEGRLAWATGMPEAAAVCDGPPAADAELCAVVFRPADDRAALAIVVVDARDGRLLWQRPCGTALARDGRDHGRGCRGPLLHEGLVVVADHAGSVTAFTRSGQPAWTYRYDAPGRPADDAAPARGSPAIAATRNALVFAPRDRGGVFALDDGGPPQATPPLRWENPVAARIVGTTPTLVVVETASSPTQLQTLAADDGRSLASSPAGRSLPGAILAGDTVIRAAATADGPALEPLDAATLRPLTPPFRIGRPGETGVSLAVGPAALAAATPGMLSCIEPHPATEPPTP